MARAAFVLAFLCTCVFTVQSSSEEACSSGNCDAGNTGGLGLLQSRSASARDLKKVQVDTEVEEVKEAPAHLDNNALLEDWASMIGGHLRSLITTANLHFQNASSRTRMNITDLTDEEQQRGRQHTLHRQHMPMRRVALHKQRRVQIACVGYVGMLLVFGLLMWSIRKKEIQCYQWIRGLPDLLRALFATAVLPASYQFMQQFGFGATMSGWFIGCLWIGETITTVHGSFIIGTISMDMRRPIVLSLLFAMGACIATFGLAADPAWDFSMRLPLLFCTRVACGFFGGYFEILNTKTMWQITPVEDYTGYEVFRKGLRTLGLGMGPLVASATTWITSKGTVDEQMACISWAVVLLYLPVLVAAWSLLPGTLCDLLDDKREKDEIFKGKACKGGSGSAGTTRIENLAPALRQQVWLAAVFFGFERAFGLASIEAATSLILEVEFGWSLMIVGLAIGLTFLCGVFMLAIKPIQRFFGISEVVILQVSSILVMTASLLFIPGIVKIISVGELGSEKEWILILLADCLMFPSFFLVNGLLSGLGGRCCVEGTRFSIENFYMLGHAGNMILRSLSPPIARTFIEQYGRGSYASVQVFMAIAGCLTCFKVVHLLKEAK